jgi:hypothetical protein
VVIPDSVTTLVDYAFSGCSNIQSVVIGNDVTRIGQSAFYNCTALTSVYYKGEASEWSSVYVAGYNGKLLDATRYYYSETEPTTSGNYWHYDENGEVAVW